MVKCRMFCWQIAAAPLNLCEWLEENIWTKNPVLIDRTQNRLLVNLISGKFFVLLSWLSNCHTSNCTYEGRAPNLDAGIRFTLFSYTLSQIKTYQDVLHPVGFSRKQPAYFSVRSDPQSSAVTSQGKLASAIKSTHTADNSFCTLDCNRWERCNIRTK